MPEGMPISDGTGLAVRLAARAGRLATHTSALAPGFVQGNLAILPAALAGDFLRFCQRNPKPCPVLGLGEPGSPRIPELGADLDLRTDLPRYRVWRRGELVAEPTDITEYWRDDLVAFVLGCSFTFEHALLEAGIPLRHVERGRNVAMWRTSIACAPAGPFAGPMVVSMRPFRPADAIRAIQITTRFPGVHGAPVHLGHPRMIGIADLDRVAVMRRGRGPSRRDPALLGLRRHAPGGDRRREARLRHHPCARLHAGDGPSEQRARRALASPTRQGDIMKMIGFTQFRRALLGALCGAGLLAAPGGAGAQQLNIQAVTQPNPAIPQYTRVDIPMLRDGLPARSNGRVRMTLSSWPERNLNGPEIVRLVRSGQVDIGAVPLNTVAGDVPLLDMPDLAGLNPTIQQARRIADALLPELNAQLQRVGVRLIAHAPYPAQVLFCRERVNSLADLRGKRIRTGGGSINDFVTAVGGQAVGIGFPEVYGALERGVVDCAITGTGSGNGARWYEVTTHMYALPVAWSTYGYFVNLAWWNRLDAPTRELLTTVFAEVQDAQWKLGDEASEDGIACNTGQRAGCSIGRLVENRPMTVTRATPEDLQTLRGILANNVLPAFVRRCGAACGETYNRIVAPISGVRYEAR